MGVGERGSKRDYMELMIIVKNYIFSEDLLEINLGIFYIND